MFKHNIIISVQLVSLYLNIFLWTTQRGAAVNEIRPCPKWLPFNIWTLGHRPSLSHTSLPNNDSCDKTRKLGLQVTSHPLLDQLFTWLQSDAMSCNWKCWNQVYTPQSIYDIANSIWVRSWNCGCLVTRFCYQLTAKPGNKTAAVPWPDPYLYSE